MAVWGQSVARAVAAPPASSEGHISAARVRLLIHRGGGPDPLGGRVHRDEALVEAVVTYTLEAPARAGQTLRLLDFASFMASEPLELDEVALEGYLQGPFRTASLEVQDVRGGSVTRAGPRRDLHVTLSPGVTELTLRYRVTVPRRGWPLGCVRRRCSLSGAIAPLPSEPAIGGAFLDPNDRVVTPVRWWVEVAEFAIPGELRTNVAGRGNERRRPEEVVVVEGDGNTTAYPSVFWGPRWYRTTEDARGLHVEVLHPHPRPSAQVPHEVFTQWRRDVVGHVLRTVREMLELASLWGLELGGSRRRLVVVHGPLRSEIAQVHPGLVIVSDQALQLLPLPRLLKFHEEALARALAEALVAGRLRGLHSPSTQLWSSGQMAFALLSPWRVLRSHRDEYALDLLRNLTFMPTVDRFLYTQQAAFSQSYFRGVDDGPPLRNHPLWFSHALPSGRRIQEKLIDTLTPDEIRCLIEGWFAHPEWSSRRAAERAYGYSLDWLYDQWLGPYPSVDYAVASVRTEAAKDGYIHAIDVERHGERPVLEPVDVLVEERGGRAHALRWNGELESGVPWTGQPTSGRHRFVLRTRRPLARVRLDPRRRLVQQAMPPNDAVDPRFNDQRPRSFRFLYTGASLSVAASEFLRSGTAAQRFNAVTGYLAFEGSYRRDLRRTGHVTLARDRESHLLVGAAMNVWRGSKVNQQRRRFRIRGALEASWLSPRSLDPRGGMRWTERLSLVDDTRRFAWWPEIGHRLELAIAARQTWRTDGAMDHRYDLQLEALWVQLWRVAAGHVFASLLHVEGVIPLGSRPEFRNLSRVGGIGGLSGYLADEAFGLAVATGMLEYRHTIVGDLHLHALNLLYLRGIGGVAFVGAASASGCETLQGWFGRQSWYAHAGYGLTARLSVLGVTPQIVRVEAAFPLVRYDGVSCLGERLPDYVAERQGLTAPGRRLPAFNLNVLFSQPF